MRDMGGSHIPYRYIGTPHAPLRPIIRSLGICIMDTCQIYADDWDMPARSDAICGCGISTHVDQLHFNQVISYIGILYMHMHMHNAVIARVYLELKICTYAHI